MNRCCVIWLILFLSGSAFAYVPSPVNKENYIVAIRVPKEVTPGSHETFIFELQNDHPHPLNYQVYISKPESWQSLSEINKVTLLPGEKKKVAFLLNIDKACEIGDKELVFRFHDPEHDIEVREVITTTVRNIHNLIITPIKKPDHLLAGQSFETTYRVKNEGNCSEEIFLSSSNGKTDIDKIILEPGHSTHVNVVQTVPQNLQYSTYISSNLLVRSEYFTEPIEKRTSVRSYPSSTRKNDPYLRFPIDLSIIYVGMKNNQPYADGFQFQAEGQGNLSRNKKHYLEFKARGPDRFGIARSLNYDQYSLEYTYKASKTTQTQLQIGDFAYNLTPLTEMFRFARGAGITHKSKKFESGLFYNQPRFIADIKEQAGAFFKYNITPFWSSQISGMHKVYHNGKGSATLESITHTFTPKDHEISLELSSGSRNAQTGYGAGFEAAGRIGKFSYNTQNIYADSDFPGYYTNSLFSNSNINYRFGNLGLNIGYSYNDANPALDTIFTTAPYSENTILGASYFIGSHTRFNVSYINRSREDRFVNKKFHYREDVVRYQLIINAKPWSAMLDGEYGQTENLLIGNDDNRANTFNLRGRLDRTFFEKLTLGGFSQYLLTNRYDQDRQSYLFYGGHVDYRLTKALHLRGSIRNNYLLEEYSNDRSLLDFELTTSKGPHSFSVKTSHALIRNTVNRTDLYINARYTYRLNAPISKEKNLYFLSGHLTGDKNDVKGVVIHMGGQSVATDSLGYFQFNDLLPGVYYLHIDPTTIDFGLLTFPATPLEVHIEPKKENKLNISILKSGELQGSINFTYLENEKAPSGHPIRIIKIFNNTHEFLTYSDSLGNFSFQHLTPGNWTVRIISNESSEKDWYIEGNNLSIDINSGETSTLQLNIRKRIRKINFSKKSFDLKG